MTHEQTIEGIKTTTKISVVDGLLKFELIKFGLSDDKHNQCWIVVNGVREPAPRLTTIMAYELLLESGDVPEHFTLQDCIFAPQEYFFVEDFIDMDTPPSWLRELEKGETKQ